jgi:hypothetical protein
MGSAIKLLAHFVGLKSWGKSLFGIDPSTALDRAQNQHMEFDCAHLAWRGSTPQYCTSVL